MIIIMNIVVMESSLVLSKPYQMEIDETKNHLIKENIQIFMLVNRVQTSTISYFS